MKGGGIQLVVLAATACGRIAFDARDPDAATADADGPPPDGPCTWSAFSAPTRLPDPLNTGFDDWAAMPFLDDTRLMLHRYETTDSDLFVASRPSTAVPFGAAVAVTELNTTSNQWTPALTEDGLVIVYADTGVTTFDLLEASRSTQAGMFTPPPP